MSNISFDRKTVTDALQVKYVLPTYQREYKWTEKQLSELLTDLQDSFLSQYDDNHGRRDVGSYKEYFLGTIITTTAEDGQKAIIDGQQRLTTMMLILSYFQRIRNITNNSGIADVENLIRKELYGQKNYNISFDPPRIELFEYILNAAITGDDLPAKVESIVNLDRGTRGLFELYNIIENYLNSDIKNRLLPFFVDFVINKVMLFEIGVPSEQDAHRVFVTMNDRGLKLAPVDLLKGYLLSNISDNQANIESHEKWSNSVNTLSQLGIEEDSQFIKSMLRATHAKSIRGKTRGDLPGDFDVIGEAYHRWVVDNKQAIPLITSDDFQNFVCEAFPKYARVYIKIKEGEAKYNENTRYLYYNGHRNLTLQSMVVMSPIVVTDSDLIVNRKVKVTSAFLDIFITSRTLSGQDNTYDYLKYPLFALTEQIRAKSIDELKVMLGAEARKVLPQIENIKNVNYNDLKRQDLLHILARIADFIEEKCSQTNAVSFKEYVDRDRGNRTFDIEHILPMDPEINRTKYESEWDFSSDAEYKELRNNIGNLILLPRGRNRSLKDKPYSEKIVVYATENISCQTLSASYFQNNPTAKDGFNQLGLMSRTPLKFNKSEIQARAEFYKDIAVHIWNDMTITNA